MIFQAGVTSVKAEARTWTLRQLLDSSLKAGFCVYFILSFTSLSWCPEVMTASSSTRPSRLLLLISFSLQGFSKVSSCCYVTCGMRLELLSVCLKAPLHNTFLVSETYSGQYLPQVPNVTRLMAGKCAHSVLHAYVTHLSRSWCLMFLFALIEDSLVVITANMAVSHTVPRSTRSCVNNGK